MPGLLHPLDLATEFSSRDNHVAATDPRVAFRIEHLPTTSFNLRTWTPRIIGKIVDWAKEQPTVQAVALVGSHARGTAQADSDIDIVVLTIIRKHSEMQPRGSKLSVRESRNGRTRIPDCFSRTACG